MMMNSHESFSSSCSDSSPRLEPERPTPDFISHTAKLPDAIRNKEEDMVGNPEGGYIGILEVYIHHARDIHNICIYQKQDVYAKLCLTSDPDTTVSTQIINGGGRNPVFNEHLQLKVQTIESSLKCEMWMLSRVKNYLEDQLLGFTLVPLSDILGANGKLMQDFSLSSTDLFHSPAGIVQLSLSYNGASPDVVALSGPPAPVAKDTALPGHEEEDPLPSELTKIEFPDPNIANENQIMVSEYFGISCTEFESKTSESLITSEDGNNLDSSISVQTVENSSHEGLEKKAPVRSVTANGSSGSSTTVASETQSNSHSISDGQDQDSPKKDSKSIDGENEINSSNETTCDSFPQPVINIKIEPEQQVVQQDIVDMYMKSMQQFTESLAKMKLPIDIENGATSTTTTPTGNSPSDPKGQQKGNGSRVFYGSRAFF